MDTLKPAAIYLRFSKAQTNEMKIEDQCAMCLETAEAHGYFVAEDAIYPDDGVSAKDGKNVTAKLGELMRAIEGGRFRAVILQNQDRLSREDELTAKLAKLCARKGVVLLTSDGEADPATSAGRFLIGLRGLLAQMEIMRKSERHNESNEQKRMRGEQIRGGVRPFGYVREFEFVGKQRVMTESLHPEEAAMVEAAYAHVLSLSEDVIGSGLSTIATRLNDAGALTTRGNRWTLPSVEKLLRRAFNAGLVEHRVKDPDTGKLKVWADLIRDDKGEPVRGSWPTIVSEDVYFAVVARLNDPRRARSKPHEPRHLLSSIALCVCGLKLRTAGRERKLDQHGNPVSVVVYRCSVHQGVGQKSDTRHVNIVADEADEVVAREVVHGMLAASSASASNPKADELREVHERLGKVRRDIEVTNERVTDADLRDSILTFKAKLRSLRAEEVALQQRLTEAAKNSAQDAVLADVRFRVSRQAGVVNINAAADAFSALLAAFQQLPLAERRALVRAYVDVTVHHGRRRQHETHLDAARRRIEVVHKIATGLNAAGEPFVQP